VLDDRGHEKAAEIRYRAERCVEPSRHQISDEMKGRGEERRERRAAVT
jgi:hypothetical protein